MSNGFSQEFADKMNRSMEMSLHKYGRIQDAYPHKVDAIASLEKRLRLYKETGNGDYLIDIANFAMIEFQLPAHHSFHYNPTDGGEGRQWHNRQTNSKNNHGEWMNLPQKEVQS